MSSSGFPPYGKPSFKGATMTSIAKTDTNTTEVSLVTASVELYCIDCSETVASLSKASGSRTLTRIHTLTLSSCRLWTDDYLEEFCVAASKVNLPLHYLALGQLANITNEGIRHISKYLRNLEVLLIHHARQVTDEGIQHLRELPDLWCVKIVGMRGLSLGAFDSLGFVSQNSESPFVYSPSFPVGLGFTYVKQMDQ
ncbi:hypothetical protein HK102_004058 [Quaeritorhiza haematococci]|nr:hypothetical protein HK102_004058 [Quaeritorhiza haematococci]